MPSNKNRDKLKAERTGKGKIIFDAVSICPEFEKGELIFKIMKIGFTLSGECVTIEEIDRAKSEAAALTKLQIQLIRTGILDIREIRKTVKLVKEDNESKKAKS